MFLIKPPFLAPETAGAPLNYGQIKEKEDFPEKARRAQSEGNPQGFCQKIDIQKSGACLCPLQNFRIAQQVVGNKSS